MSLNVRYSFVSFLSAATLLFSGAMAVAECTVYRNGRKEPCSFLTGQPAPTAKPSVTAVAEVQSHSSAVSDPVTSTPSIPPGESAGNAIAAALYRVSPVAAAARAGVLKKLVISPETPVKGLHFSSAKEFLRVWRSDTRTFLEAAFIGLQQDNPKISSLWDGKRKKLSAEEVRIGRDLKPWLAETAVLLARRIQWITIDLVPNQIVCGERVIAFTRPHTAAQNQMSVCPVLTSLTWTAALQTMIHEAAHHEMNSGNECLITRIEYTMALAAGFEPVKSGYHEKCKFN